MICSGGVGGLNELGWMLLLQPERGQRVVNNYAIIIEKSLVQLANVYEASN